MTSRLLSLLKRIVGGIKKMITDMVVQVGIMCIPLGVVILLASFQFFEGWRMYVVGVLALIVTASGYWAFRLAIKAARLEETEKEDKFNTLIEEIKGLRKDIAIKGGSDGDSKDK